MKIFNVDNLGILVVLFIFAFAMGAAVYVGTKKNDYIYIARGVECAEYDRDNNILKDCNFGELGKVDIINPISVIRIKLED
jgi:hypothetical protein